MISQLGVCGFVHACACGPVGGRAGGRACVGACVHVCACVSVWVRVHTHVCVCVSRCVGERVPHFAELDASDKVSHAFTC